MTNDLVFWTCSSFSRSIKTFIKSYSTQPMIGLLKLLSIVKLKSQPHKTSTRYTLGQWQVDVSPRTKVCLLEPFTPKMSTSFPSLKLKESTTSLLNIYIFALILFFLFSAYKYSDMLSFKFVRNPPKLNLNHRKYCHSVHFEKCLLHVIFFKF